jgi:hypothetical protein
LMKVESNRIHPRSRLTIWHKRLTGLCAELDLPVGSSIVLTGAASLSGSAPDFDSLRDKAL